MGRFVQIETDESIPIQNEINSSVEENNTDTTIADEVNSSTEIYIAQEEPNLYARGFGALATPPNILDSIPIAYSPSGSSGVALPLFVDLSPQMPPVGDQGMQNSCVGWAVGYYLKSFQERVEHNRDYTYSPAFVYNISKMGSCESGAYVADALAVLQDIGITPWEDMPYNSNECSTPTHEAIEKAKCAKVADIKRLDTQSRHFISNMRYFLYQSSPIVVTIKPYKEFIAPKLYSGEYFFTDINTSQTPPAFLHSVLVVGYDDTKRAFKIVNSWGVEWGNGGYLWIDYSVMQTITIEAFWIEDAKSPCVIENSQIKEIEAPEPIIDKTPVSLIISDNLSGTAEANLIHQEWVAPSVTFAFEFSNDVSGFDSSDIEVTNATKSNFRGSGRLYYIDVVPPLHSTQTINLSVSANSAVDGNGNGNLFAKGTQNVNTVKAFVTTWDTTQTDDTTTHQIQISTNWGYSYNYSIDWGDGESNHDVAGDITHTYQDEGVYTLSITGNFPAIYFNESSQIKDSLKHLKPPV